MIWESGRNTTCHLHGQFLCQITTRLRRKTDFLSDAGQVSDTSSYTDDIVSSGASFHPTGSVTLNVTENYTSNLNGYFAQNVAGNGTPDPGLSLGTGAHSSTLGGGATYQFTKYLSASSQATYYDQSYLGTAIPVPISAER